MMQVFADMCHENRKEGAAGLLRLWVGVAVDLVTTVLKERSRAVERTLSVAGRHFSLPNLMAVNGALLIFAGLAMFIAALNVLMAYDLLGVGQIPGVNAPNSEWLLVLPVKLMTQTFGVACVCFGMFLIASSGSSLLRAQGFAGVLSVGNAMLATAVLLNTAQYPTIVGTSTAGVLLALALGYVGFWLKGFQAGKYLEDRTLA